MPITEPLPVCDDVRARHQWYEPFADGDTCACGRFYLDLHPHPHNAGLAAELREAPPATDDDWRKR